MRLLHRFNRDRRGVSAIEFAFIAPVLILIYFSVAELCQAMLVERKVSHAASAVGDLVTQPCPNANPNCPAAGTVTPAELTDIYNAASAIVAPFSTSSMEIRVDGIVTDANDNATVQWSNAQNTTKLAQGTAVTLPANLLGPSQMIVRAQVVYTYNSPLNYWFKNAVTFNPVFYLLPRATPAITCPTC